MMSVQMTKRETKKKTMVLNFTDGVNFLFSPVFRWKCVDIEIYQENYQVNKNSQSAAKKEILLERKLRKT